jgi:hypothetical protein
MTLAISRADSPNNIERWLDAVRTYASISFTSGASTFSRALKWSAGIWLAGNLRVIHRASGIRLLGNSAYPRSHRLIGPGQSLVSPGGGRYF